jgi:predicted HAD superfamily Cof-like phosphohydrolase
MHTHELDVFHKLSNQITVPYGSLKTTTKAIELYTALFGEELNEFIKAGYEMSDSEQVKETEEKYESYEALPSTIDMKPTEELAHVAKEALDVVVVTYGYMKSMGLPVEELWDELMRELNSKYPLTFREDGKVLKGDNFKKADFLTVIQESYLKNKFAEFEYLNLGEHGGWIEQLVKDTGLPHGVLSVAYGRWEQYAHINLKALKDCAEI